MEGSKIFAGYQALGFVCNHVPLGLLYHARKREHYVVSSTGKAFHTYSCSKLALVAISDTHPEDITCLAADAFLTYTACQNVIRAFTLGQKAKHTYVGHEHNVHLLLPFGSHLISVDESSNMKIWDIASEEVYSDIEFGNEIFHVTALVHPSTYLNKILIGSKQGMLQLWNIKRNQRVHRFEGWGSAVTVLEQAPAVDVIAIGLEDGRIIVRNIKYDETIVSFAQDWGAITAIGFRTDGQPIMATGSKVGHIALWNLEERKLQAQMRNVHDGPVSGLRFLTTEPVMVTNSVDNALKMWLLDLPDGSGRLLRKRSGHSAPPTRIRFHGHDGKTLISAGHDSSIKAFSLIHESQNKDLGQAYINKKFGVRLSNKQEHLKMGPITALATETSKESDWDGLAACHDSEPTVTTWNYQISTMGKHKICPKELENETGVQATALDISSCGNFILIGWSTGDVMMFNIQSGIFRGRYGNDKAHTMAVRGVCVDGLNQILMTGGADKTIKFWHLKKKILLHILPLEWAVNQLKLHRESSMLAAALDDFSVIIIDMELRRIVRKFTGHQNRVTDMAFSTDARWLITSSMDCTIRAWDLPSSRLVDCFLLDAAVTSLSLSPTNDFLATTHVDDLGVYLWSNKTLYSHITLPPLPEDYEPSIVMLPGTNTLNEDESGNEETDSGVGEDLEEFKSPEQISEGLITLSLLPNSRWQSLANIDLIKQRNKPKEPPKVPKSAPFFLPVAAGLQPKFDVSGIDEEQRPKGQLVISANVNNQSELCIRLEQSTHTADYSEVMEYLQGLTPSAIDIEFRSLSPVGGGSTEALLRFMQFLKLSLESNKNFELIQSYLSLFTKLHGDEISKELSLIKELEELTEQQRRSWQRIQRQFNQSLCLINYLKSAVL